MKKLSILSLLLVLAWTSFAQQASSHSYLRISGLNENFGLSAFPSDTPLHVGGSIAYAFTRKESQIYRSLNSVELGYFRHAPFMQAAYLAWKPSYEWQFNNGLQLHGTWGIGYLHALPTQQSYTEQNGIYKATTNPGKPGGMASVGLGIGYQLAQQSDGPITLFTRQEWMLVAPFNLYDDLPGSVHSMLSVGIQFSLF